MKDICWIVPSRGRPGNVATLVDAFEKLAVRSELVFVFDNDDPELAANLDAAGSAWVLDNGTRGCCAPLNRVARAVAPHYRYLGFMGDDHRPRTSRFDVWLAEAIGDLGVAYGNDLIHGPNLPSSVLMSSNIVDTLGFFAPPAQRHLFLDNFWLALGARLDRCSYLSGVVIEHMHPIVGKAPADDLYRTVNADVVLDGDQKAWTEYFTDGRFDADAERILAEHAHG